MEKRLITLVAGCLLASCSGPYSGEKVAAKTEPSTLSVDTLKLRAVTIPEVVNANGELLAEEQASVSNKVPGRVQKLNVDLGSIVKKDQVLAELEKEDYEFRVRQAEAMVEQIRARLGLSAGQSDEVKPEQTAIVREADAALKESRFIFETTAKLQKEGVVSRIDYEKANVRMQGVEARYQAAVQEVLQSRSLLSERRAQLALARQNLSDTTIRAPFSGAITRRQASLGEFLPVNAAVVTLVRQHPLRVRLEVPERYAAKVKMGQRIEIRLQGSSLLAGGRVVRLSPAIDAQNRSLIVEGEIPNQDGLLRPGSFVEGVITVDAGAVGIAIPMQAVTSFAGVEKVFLVNNGLLDERQIRTGRKLNDGLIEIVEGLKENEVVVSAASDRMVIGQKVSSR